MFNVQVGSNIYNLYIIFILWAYCLANNFSTETTMSLSSLHPGYLLIPLLHNFN